MTDAAPEHCKMTLRLVLLILLFVPRLSTTGITLSRHLSFANTTTTNGARGAVYAISNDVEKNTIVGYIRSAKGDFPFSGRVRHGWERGDSR